jgi:hypothetical protein
MVVRETSRIPHCLDNMLTDGGEVVSLTHQPPLYSSETFYFYFCFIYIYIAVQIFSSRLLSKDVTIRIQDYSFACGSVWV